MCRSQLRYQKERAENMEVLDDQKEANEAIETICRNQLSTRETI